jgi:hypothetical protein
MACVHFIPYSHVDGGCGWVDANWTGAATRFVATRGSPEFINEKLGLGLSNPALNLTSMTTGWANHDDRCWRPGKGRDNMRAWLEGALV